MPHWPPPWTFYQQNLPSCFQRKGCGLRTSLFLIGESSCPRSIDPDWIGPITFLIGRLQHGHAHMVEKRWLNWLHFAVRHFPWVTSQLHTYIHSMVITQFVFTVVLFLFFIKSIYFIISVTNLIYLYGFLLYCLQSMLEIGQQIKSNFPANSPAHNPKADF